MKQISKSQKRIDYSFDQSEEDGEVNDEADDDNGTKMRELAIIGMN